MVKMLMKFQETMKKMNNRMSVGLCKCPWSDQYVAPQGYSFYKEGRRLGRIIWLKQNELDGIYIDKDEAYT